MTNIFTDEPCCSNFPDVDSKMGQRTGDDPNENVIWWSEGNATFFGYLHGSANLAEFKSNMRDRLESDSTFGMSNKAEYLTRGTKLYNIPYGRDAPDWDTVLELGSLLTSLSIMVKKRFTKCGDHRPERLCYSIF